MSRSTTALSSGSRSGQRGFEDRAAQARALTERTSDLSATARVGDGIVEVTVGSDDHITSLRLDEEIDGIGTAVVAAHDTANALRSTAGDYDAADGNAADRMRNTR